MLDNYSPDNIHYSVMRYTFNTPVCPSHNLVHCHFCLFVIFKEKVACREGCISLLSCHQMHWRTSQFQGFLEDSFHCALFQGWSVFFLHPYNPLHTVSTQLVWFKKNEIQTLRHLCFCYFLETLSHSNIILHLLQNTVRPQTMACSILLHWINRNSLCNSFVFFLKNFHAVILGAGIATIWCCHGNLLDCLIFNVEEDFTTFKSVFRKGCSLPK